MDQTDTNAAFTAMLEENQPARWCAWRGVCAVPPWPGAAASIPSSVGGCVTWINASGNNGDHAG